MEILPFYKKSFFASPDIENGLNLTILYDEGIVFCDLMLDKRFAAGDGYVYGGLLFGVMDSLMWYAILMEKKKMEGTGATLSAGPSERYRRKFGSLSVGTVTCASGPQTALTSSMMESRRASAPVLLAPL